MKTDFSELKKLIEGMGDNDYLMDHDLNLTIFNPSLRASIKTKLDIKNRSDVSRFLTMVICFSENGAIDEEIITWNVEQYKAYLDSGEITEEQNMEYVEEFLENF